jgi:hydroxymethylpyrimidine pyrophosphatase-like HAD family hydrolase
MQEVKAHNCLNGELVNRKFDKGLGVRKIAEYYNVPIEDTYGFGDSMNDLEMIETVGHSVCMENGAEALKAVSDMICPSVEEDGLMKAFEELGLM